MLSVPKTARLTMFLCNVVKTDNHVIHLDICLKTLSKPFYDLAKRLAVQLYIQ